MVRWNDDSMDTMDMYRLFENKDLGKASEAELMNNLSEAERVKWVNLWLLLHSKFSVTKSSYLLTSIVFIKLSEWLCSIFLQQNKSSRNCITYLTRNPGLNILQLSNTKELNSKNAVLCLIRFSSQKLLKICTFGDYSCI